MGLIPSAGFLFLLVVISSKIKSSALMAQPPKVVFLDRDGVINEDVGSPGVVRIDQLQLTRNAGYGIGRLKRQDGSCRVVVITNQSCVGKGLITLDELHQIHERLQDLLLDEDKDAKIDSFYCCTSTDQGMDPRKKPAPGMILEALSDLSLEAQDAVMVGDSLRDLQAAKAAGIPQRVLVSTGYGASLMNGHRPSLDDGSSAEYVQHLESPTTQELRDVLPFTYCHDLAHAVDHLLL